MKNSNIACRLILFTHRSRIFLEIISKDTFAWSDTNLYRYFSPDIYTTGHASLWSQPSMKAKTCTHTHTHSSRELYSCLYMWSLHQNRVSCRPNYFVTCHTCVKFFSSAKQCLPNEQNRQIKTWSKHVMLSWHCGRWLFTYLWNKAFSTLWFCKGKPKHYILASIKIMKLIFRYCSIKI